MKKIFIIITIMFMFIPSMGYAKEESAFKNIVVDGGSGNYKVRGDAHIGKDYFYYSVEDGHTQFIEESKIQTGKAFGDAYPFVITVTIPKGKLPKNGTLIMNLYTKSEKGDIQQSHPVVLEVFE
ncbi:intracellular proteinase inhibitor [Robertmurraya korlensis]|uniref:intracellular proteinase inhibitor n=1 Tax=Robertmurraya korlensis TaxID=519977 RepID=UPI00203E48A6|nr:intracellular proteinase inhibitor [Robertmurraya korlensis]MCM3602376.1 intracellular proteinase inhibitor [Robertmurraya korlensis]